ncbi:uncharacterized protein BKCO1_10000113 [Diplodia corticola]|uniref:Integral membrane protein n=1 Tax=Diplodia corticola TaxID=236234 RepID=A0A1J9R5C3_9PEZI|nr:uncharacterized protein BKCO1_10000113 [Diplodia corticola]OJD36694.1 integral membrane protein [Diplodia corticola]
MLLESLRPPLELVFEWQTSKFPHGIRRGWGLIILIGVLYPICLIAVVLRTRVRVRRRSFGADDGLIILAVLFAAGVDISLILGAPNPPLLVHAVLPLTQPHPAFLLYGYDRHVWDVTQPMALQARKVSAKPIPPPSKSSPQANTGGTGCPYGGQMILAIELLNSTSTCLTKISILSFYRRLGRGTYTTTFLLIVQTNMALIVAYLVSFSIVLVLTCRPVAAYWLQFSVVWAAQERNSYRCVNEAANTIAANAVSIAQDLVACGLPSVLLWKLQMGRGKKFLLGALLGLGILPCIAGLLRLLYTVRAYSGTYDATWAAHPIFVWTVVETHLGILCACAPALHSYAKEALQKAAAGGSATWLTSGRLCESTLGFIKYLSSRSWSRGTATGTGSSEADASGDGSGSGSFFWGKGRRKRRRGSVSGHVELEEGGGGGGGGGRGGGGGSGGTGSGTGGSSSYGSSIGDDRDRGGRGGGSRGGGSDGGNGGAGEFGGKKGRHDSGGVSRSAGTLLSSSLLSTLDEAGSERSMMVDDADVSDTGAAEDDGDLERGFFSQSGQLDEKCRKREGGVWDWVRLPKAWPVGLPEPPPAAYLGAYRQQAEHHRWTEDEVPLSTASRPVRGDQVSHEDIGLAITTNPPTIPRLLHDERHSIDDIECI